MDFLTFIQSPIGHTKRCKHNNINTGNTVLVMQLSSTCVKPSYFQVQLITFSTNIVLQSKTHKQIPDLRLGLSSFSIHRHRGIRLCDCMNGVSCYMVSICTIHFQQRAVCRHCIGIMELLRCLFRHFHRDL